MSHVRAGTLVQENLSTEEYKLMLAMLCDLHASGEIGGEEFGVAALRLMAQDQKGDAYSYIPQTDTWYRIRGRDRVIGQPTGPLRVVMPALLGRQIHDLAQEIRTRCPPIPGTVPDAPSASWRLVVTAGADAGRSYELGRTARIGRRSSNEIAISEPLASRRHAVLEWRQDGLVITDLGSTHGTYVNGTRISGPTYVREQDTVGIGQSQYRIVARAGQHGGA